MERICDLLLLSLSVTGLLQVWLEGSIFANIRSWLEVRQYHYKSVQLLLCPLCLSVWLVTFYTFLFYVSPPDWKTLWCLPAGVPLVKLFYRY